MYPMLEALRMTEVNTPTTWPCSLKTHPILTHLQKHVYDFAGDYVPDVGGVADDGNG